MTAVTAPTQTAAWSTTAFTVAGSTTRKLLRTPQVFGIAVVQSVVFLLMFRYVLGGAIGVPGVAYVDFLVPGFVVSGILFTGGGSAVAVAEDAASGIYGVATPRPRRGSASWRCRSRSSRVRSCRSRRCRVRSRRSPRHSRSPSW